MTMRFCMMPDILCNPPWALTSQEKQGAEIEGDGGRYLCLRGRGQERVEPVISILWAVLALVDYSLVCQNFQTLCPVVVLIVWCTVLR
jgi:hypothetical protein